MSILVFGRSGQVAQALQEKGDVIALGRHEANLLEPEMSAAAIRDRSPVAVINAAAYTAVDQAEDEPEIARRINTDAPAAMARACADLDIPLVHISTDYVFDGSGSTAFSTDHQTAPLGVYGTTKRDGEEAIRASGARHAILRTSWVFSATGNNFLKTMLRLGAERDRLRIVADQIGGPTPADAIAAACLKIAAALPARPETSGTYHFSGSPDTSWAGFARAIFEAAELPCKIDEIPSSEFPTKAQRPLNSRLDCAETESVFGLSRPDWHASLGPILTRLRTTR